MRKFFSQGGEDFVLSKVLPTPTGYFVEVGAFDGRHLSNSYSFELAGWDGLCIEAHPRFAYLCDLHRGCQVIHAACVGPGMPNRIDMQIEDLGLLSGIEADKTEGMERRYASRGMEFHGFDRVEVEAITLTDALDRAGAPSQLDFVSIDVEGTELEVLRGLDFARFSVRVLVIETNTDEQRRSIADYLVPHKFLLARRIGQNDFFAADEATRRHIASINIECTIEDMIHPDGEQATHPLHRGRTITAS